MKMNNGIVIKTQKCRKCGIEKPLGSFSRDYRTLDGIRVRCKDCCNQIAREKYAENAEKICEQKKIDGLKYTKSNSAACAKWREKNKDYQKKYRHDDPSRYLWQNAFKRASKNGLEFNIDISDIIIPEYCPVLGIPLFKSKENRYGACMNSPTLDRIDNNKGYIKGNICVISWRANSLKKDATIEELEKIIQYIKKYVI